MKTIRKHVLIPAFLVSGALVYLTCIRLPGNHQAAREVGGQNEKQELLVSDSSHSSLPSGNQVTQIIEFNQAIQFAGPAERTELLTGFVEKLEEPAIREVLAALD